MQVYRRSISQDRVPVSVKPDSRYRYGQALRIVSDRPCGVPGQGSVAGVLVRAGAMTLLP